MRVAVVYSGIPRFDWEENLYLHRKIFPDWFHFFYTCWDHYELHPYSYVGIRQPRIEFHPWYDCQDPEMWEVLRDSKDPETCGINPRDRWLREHTLQHIGHALALESFGKPDFDVIIRMRYDMRISDQIDWAHWCKKVFKENRPAGFWFSANKGDHEEDPNPDWIHFQKKWDARFIHWHTREALQKHGYIEKDRNNFHGFSNIPFIPDALLIHRNSHFNIERVKKMWETGHIRPAEFGWYQLLVEENFGARSNHAIKIVGGGYKTW